MVWLGLLLILACVVPARAQTWVDQVIGAEDPAALKVPVAPGPEIWKNPSAPLEARINDLVRRLSLAEKATLLLADAPAIPHLGIPAYSFCNECAIIAALAFTVTLSGGCPSRPSARRNQLPRIR